MMMAVGNSPKLQKAKFSADKSNTLLKINMFVRAQLAKHIKAEDSIILYVKSQFAPPLDARICDLYEVSGRRG